MPEGPPRTGFCSNATYNTIVSGGPLRTGLCSYTTYNTIVSGGARRTGTEHVPHVEGAGGGGGAGHALQAPELKSVTIAQEVDWEVTAAIDYQEEVGDLNYPRNQLKSISFYQKQGCPFRVLRGGDKSPMGELAHYS